MGKMRLQYGQYTLTSIRATLRESQDQGKGASSSTLPLSVIEEDAEDMVDVDIDRGVATQTSSTPSCSSSAYPSSLFCSIRVCSGSRIRRTHLAQVEYSKGATGSLGVAEWQDRWILSEASKVADVELHLEFFEGKKGRGRDKTPWEVLSRKLALLSVGSSLDYPEHWDGGEGIKDESRFKLVGFSTFMVRRKDTAGVKPRFTKHKLQDSTGKWTGEVEVGLIFTPCLLEGFLSYTGVGGFCMCNCQNIFSCFSPITGSNDDRRKWFQLLEDGRILSWSSPSQKENGKDAEDFGIGTHQSCIDVSLIGNKKDQFRIDVKGDGVWQFKAGNESQAKAWVQALQKVWL